VTLISACLVFRLFQKYRTMVLRLIMYLFLLLSFPSIVLSQNHGTDQVQNMILENARIKVQLAGDKPSILEYRVKKNGGVISGNPGNAGPSISFYKGSETVMLNRTEVTYEVSQAANTVHYHVQVDYDNQEAIEFDLDYLLNDYDVKIFFRNVVEHRDFYLLDVLLPGLITVSSDENPGYLVIPADAGRLIDIEKASLKSYEFEIDWLNPVLTAFAYNSEVLGILDTKSIENHTVATVYENEKQRFGSLSMRIMHRLNVYDLEEFGTVIPAHDAKYFLKLQDSCEITLSIIGDYDGDGSVSWVDGTKKVREGIDAAPNPYYKDKTFIRTFLDRKGSENEEITFDKVLERIRVFAAQTDSAACVMYLLGWQYTGHDTGYPSVDKVNENLGGFGRLVHLIEEARKYNVLVPFYDNYDDSYPDHPGWDPDVICEDPQGNLMRGGAWDGEQSYLISSYKYAVKSGVDRVRYTLDQYPIREAYFIDVLAGGFNGGRKYDFNPKSPAGAIKNFYGKLMILEEFNKKGIDVATEDFTGYFVGHVGTFGDIIAFDNIYFKEEQQIPMIPFIYHGKTSFGMKTSNSSFYPRTWLYGQRAQKFTNKRRVFTPADYILDALPKQKFYGKSMKSYERYGDFERVTYEDGSIIEANVKSGSYKAIMDDGLLIAKDYTSFTPAGKNLIFACSRPGGWMRYKIPNAWKNTEKIKVYLVNREGNLTEMKSALDGRYLEFLAEPNVPYKVLYNE